MKLMWNKEDKSYLTLIKALLMSLLPVLCCLVYCGMQGRTIGEVYLPASEWNDELFYFKQVESIINYGYPQGYYGFNESHALKLSFAAWSPALVWPWVLWGTVFGWNLLSPIICNIVFLSIAVFLFVWLVKPTWKQMGVLTLLFCLFTYFVRYMLSGMPEVICFGMLIVFYGLTVNYLEKEKTYKLVLLFVMAGLMVLMRPYLLLFLLLPVYLWCRKSKWKGLLGSVLIFAVVLGCYVLINHYLSAEYFAPLFFTDWITTFFEEGIGAGIRNFFGTLYYKGVDLLGHLERGVKYGASSGAFFVSYLIMLAILLWQSVSDWRRLRRLNGQAEGIKNWITVEAHLAFCFVGMLFAVLLMYKLSEGSRHLATFIAAAIFVISLMRTKYFKKAVLLGVTFAYFFSYMAVDPYNYQVPFAEETKLAQAEYWEEVFTEELELVEENVPNYDNVVIWVFNDTLGSESVNTKWQVLYTLPEGFGISCCMPDYVMENLENLQSRYLATVVGGVIDHMCEELEYREIGRDEEVVVYERY